MPKSTLSERLDELARTSRVLRPFDYYDGPMPSDHMPKPPPRKSTGPVQIKVHVDPQPTAPPPEPWKPDAPISTRRYVGAGELVNEEPRRQPATARHFRADQVRMRAAEMGAVARFETAADPAPTCSFCGPKGAIMPGDVFVALEGTRQPDRVACAGCCSKWPYPME